MDYKLLIFWVVLPLCPHMNVIAIKTYKCVSIWDLSVILAYAKNKLLHTIVKHIYCYRKIIRSYRKTYVMLS
jgi:hypothetical protein